MANLLFVKYDDSLKEAWEEINKNAQASFLTSIDWIEFQKYLGKEIELFLIKDEDSFIGNFYIEIYRRRISKYAYSPYGPVLDLKKVNNLENIFIEIRNFQKEFIQQRSLNCFRMDPLTEASLLNTFTKIGYVKAMAPTQAKYVWEIDITKSEDELLREMKKVARYNIKKSSEVGFKVMQTESVEDINNFYAILSETFRRQQFTSFGKEYFIKQFEQLYSKGLCKVFLCYKKGEKGKKFVSAALINVFNKKAFYSHGGSLSDPEAQKYGASYLLHWEIIKSLKELGIEKYNMWGVVPEGMNVKSGMKGVSDFKKRFGGYQIDYVGALDLPNRFMYSIQRLAEYFIYRKDRY